MALSEKNIRNVFLYILPKFASYGLNLISLPILSRLLTPADFGVFTLSLAFPAIAVTVVTVGMTSSVPRYYFEYRNDPARMNAFFFSVQLYLIVMLLISASGVYFAREYLSGLIFGVAGYGGAITAAYMSTYLGTINMVYLRIYQNEERAGVYASFVTLQAVVTVLGSLLLVWQLNMSYMGMVYGSLCGAAAAFVAISIHFNRMIRISFSWEILRENMKYGLQVVPKSFSGFINRFFDKYMLNSMMSISAVGIFNIGQTIAGALDILMSNVWMSFQPVVYREVFDRPETGGEVVGKIFTTFACVTLLPLMLGILFAQEALYLIFPPEYHGAAIIIVILTTGMTSQSFGRIVSVQYAYSKRPFWIFPITLIGTGMNVVANILLIPRLGLVGAGLSTVASTTLMNVALVLVGQRLYRIQYEWKVVVRFYMVVMASVVCAAYFNTVGTIQPVMYGVKLGLIGLYLWAGARAGVITRESVAKIYNAFARKSAPDVR